MLLSIDGFWNDTKEEFENYIISTQHEGLTDPEEFYIFHFELDPRREELPWTENYLDFTVTAVREV